MGTTQLKAVTLYLTPQEYQDLKNEADAHGVTTSYFLRALIDQYSPIKLPPLNRRGAPQGNSNAKGKPVESQ